MKYTKAQLQTIKHYVLDTLMTRLTVEESLDYIANKTGFRLNYNSLAGMRGKLRKEAQEHLTKLRTDNFEYHYEFLQRIYEIRNLQRNAWQLYETTQSDFVKINTIKELHALTRSLANLYDLIPLMSNTPEYVKHLVSQSKEEAAKESEAHGFIDGDL